jgi:hypothetical protein
MLDKLFIWMSHVQDLSINSDIKIFNYIYVQKYCNKILNKKSEYVYIRIKTFFKITKYPFVTFLWAINLNICVLGIHADLYYFQGINLLSTFCVELLCCVFVCMLHFS